MTQRIMFEVPKGFRGVFELLFDENGPPTDRNQSGVWIYRIPENAVLRIRSNQPLNDWHSTSAEFSDGTKLDVSMTSPIAPFADDEVKLRFLYSESSGHSYFLVGTEAELDAALKNRTRLRLGGVVSDREPRRSLNA